MARNENLSGSSSGPTAPLKMRTGWQRARPAKRRLVKVKLTQQQEFVIGGYTPPEGARKYFGALLVGYYGTGGLLFAGSFGNPFS